MGVGVGATAKSVVVVGRLFADAGMISVVPTLIARGLTWGLAFNSDSTLMPYWKAIPPISSPFLTVCVSGVGVGEGRGDGVIWVTDGAVALAVSVRYGVNIPGSVGLEMDGAIVDVAGFEGSAGAHALSRVRRAPNLRIVLQIECMDGL
jgi:hypothetical protein